MQLDQIKAVVTGGVSGLGFAVARHLVAHGASVALCDINDEKGAAAVAELGAKARYQRVDVTSATSSQYGQESTDYFAYLVFRDGKRLLVNGSPDESWIRHLAGRIESFRT